MTIKNEKTRQELGLSALSSRNKNKRKTNKRAVLLVVSLVAVVMVTVWNLIF